MSTTGLLRLFTLILSVLLLFSGFPCSAAPAGGKEKKELKFRWAFGAIRGSANAPGVEQVTKDHVLKSGDKLKVMIELHRKCFVYLIHRNAQGEVNLLFPYSLKQFETDYQPGRGYYVPKGDAWFQLDSKTGSESFYLIASDQRMLDVEYLYERYVASEASKKEEFAGQMLAKINSLRQQYQASGNEAEVLASSEAVQRGFERATGADPTDISGIAKDIAFNNL